MYSFVKEHKQELHTAYIIRWRDRALSKKEDENPTPLGLEKEPGKKPGQIDGSQEKAISDPPKPCDIGNSHQTLSKLASHKGISRHRKPVQICPHYQRIFIILRVKLG